jgi:hypothetical protein
MEGSSVSVIQGLSEPAGNFSEKFESQGEPAISQTLAINHARAGF